jgi:tetratricopeptide (TPR) repeat protein
MRSCICLFYIALFFAPALDARQPAGPPGQTERDPDALYRERATMGRAREAADLLESRLTANPRDFDAAWKLARVMYWIGGHDTPDAQRRALERGVEAGRLASTLEPKRPEGYFWMAADMGTLAESYGMRQGLKYRGAIKDALETVLRLDPAFLQGSADRALGRWYHKVPGLFGGSKRKAEEHLRRSLMYDPNSTASHFFLAELLFDMDRDADAVSELETVIALPINPEWAPEDREFKQKAADRLAKVKS